MKMLFNNKGISLVVLLVAITLISVLGASFVSLIGSKHKGFLHQIDSYRALNIANGGVEYAIRFASEPPDSINDSIFFSNPALTTIGKSFGGGTFSINYTYDQTIANDVLRAIGIYNGSSREVRLHRFRRYISPITLVPTLANRPHIDGNDIIIPVISNNDGAFDVTRIDVRVTLSSNTYLTIVRDGVNVFSYDARPDPPCDTAAPVPVCKDATQGIYLGAGDVNIRFDLLLPNTHSPDSLSTYALRFSGPPPSGRCTVDFYTSLSVGKPFGIQFSL